MQAQLLTDIGEFKAGRIGNIVESPMATTQLIDHNESPLVPERESCEDAFDYWFEPVLASNESAALKGTKIPVLKTEIKLLGGNVTLDRKEVFEITRDVNLHIKGIVPDKEKFEAHTARSAVLREENPEEFDAIRDEIIDLVTGFNIYTEEHVKEILTKLELSNAISDWSLEDVEKYIAEAKNHEYPELIVSAILNSDPARYLFIAIEKAFLDAK